MKWLFPLLSFISFLSFGQKSAYDFPEIFEFKIVDTSIHGTKDELFVKASSWMAKNYRSANNVVQLSDKEAGKIIGKCVMVVKPGSSLTWNVYHTITIELKDGKTRCTLSDFIQDGNYSGTSRNANKIPAQRLDDPEPNGGFFSIGQKTWDKIKQAASDEAKQTLRDFKKYMRTEAIERDGFD